MDALYINTPPTENRVQLTISTVELAKKAGVKHVAVASMTTADLTDTIFGRQFNEIEEKIPKLGIPYTFIRLPRFMENYLGYKDTVVNQGAVYGPADPEKKSPAIAVEDGGKALAAILVNPSSYANDTIDIISNYHSFNDLVQGFSAGRRSSMCKCLTKLPRNQC